MLMMMLRLYPYSIALIICYVFFFSSLMAENQIKMFCLLSQEDFFLAEEKLLPSLSFSLAWLYLVSLV